MTMRITPTQSTVQQTPQTPAPTQEPKQIDSPVGKLEIELSNLKVQFDALMDGGDTDYTASATGDIYFLGDKFDAAFKDYGIEVVTPDGGIDFRGTFMEEFKGKDMAFGGYYSRHFSPTEVSPIFGDAEQEWGAMFRIPNE